MSRSTLRASSWRRLALVAGLLALAVVAAPASAQTTRPFDVTITSHLGKNKAAAQCGLLICGTTTVPGFGEADFTLIPVAPGPTGGRGCVPGGAIVFLDLRSTGDRLVLEIDGQVCFPGNSANAPGALKSYGNPLRASGTYEITGGTGVFEGATGSGTASLVSAGAHVSGRATGTLTLP
jgi:hypothetical protein